MKPNGITYLLGPKQWHRALPRKTNFFEKSKFAHNVTQAHLQRLGNSQQNIHRWHSKTALDLPHVNWIDVNPFGQLFLCQDGQLPVFADAFAKTFTIFFCDHNWSISKSGNVKTSQILLAIIFPLAFFRELFKGRIKANHGACIAMAVYER